MFTKTAKQVVIGLSTVTMLSLCASLTFAQEAKNGEVPYFQGFPSPDSTSGGGALYTPFNPSINPGAMNNPYNAYGAPGGYYPPYWSPYSYPDPIGSYLYGSSSVINSAGQFYMNQEMAQYLRQVALQKQLETTKLAFDLKKYIKENTPTYTEEMMKIAEDRLKRILTNATPAEIANGKALNVLLRDLRNQDLEKVSVKSHYIAEKILRRLNITFLGKGNLGVLRNDGRFTWPIALLDDELVPKETRENINIQAEKLVSQAANGAINANTYKDLKNNIDNIREKLVAKVLEIPTGQYMQAKRFLDNFNEALLALQEPNVVSAYYDYHKFCKNGKTVEELIQYMKEEGLEFGSAIPGDEGAYQAVYSALANYDLLFNTRLVTSKKD